MQFGQALPGSVVAVVAFTIGGAVADAAGQSALIGVELVGPPGQVSVGQIIDVQVRLKREPVDTLLPIGDSFTSLDLVFAWNPAHLRLAGLSQAGAVPLLASFFPSPSFDYTGINEIVPPQDGDGLYFAFGPLGDPVPVSIEGVLVTTFRFEVLSAFVDTWVEVLPELTVDRTGMTVVYDGTIAGLDVTGSFTHAVIHQMAPCLADFNGDSVVDGTDLVVVLGAWGRGASMADLNQDGVVDGSDLAIVLGAWGPCPGS